MTTPPAAPHPTLTPPVAPLDMQAQIAALQDQIDDLTAIVADQQATIDALAARAGVDPAVGAGPRGVGQQAALVGGLRRRAPRVPPAR